MHLRPLVPQDDSCRYRHGIFIAAFANSVIASEAKQSLNWQPLEI